VPPAEEPNVVRFQAVKELTDAPEEVVLDYVPLSNGAAEGERRSMAVAVRKELYAAIQQMCAAANLKLAGVTPRPYAVAAGLGRAFAANVAPAPESKADAVAVLTAGPGGGEFTVARNGEVIFTRAVKAPAVASEAALVAEVRRNLTTYAGSNPAHPVQALYVAEADGRWTRRLGIALGIPVHAYDPLAGAAPDVPEHTRGRFAGAVGVLAAQAAGTLPINFASPRQPKAELDPKRNQYALAALAGLGVFAALAGWGYLALSAADRDLNKLTARRTELQNQANTLEPDAKRLAAVQAWQSRKVGVLDELVDAANRVPPGVSVSSITIKDIQPNAKTGKQDEGQATVSLRLTLNESASSALVDRMTNEMGRVTDPKAKDPKDPKKPRPVYPEVKLTNVGSEYTLFARIFGRDPTAYAPAPAPRKLNRDKYPPASSKSGEVDRSGEAEAKDPDPKAEPAPDPKLVTPAGD
jgi:hypothetical protein